jgi:hypothetical protein
LAVIPADHAYTVLLIGQILAACAQPFVMFAPTKLAALWFPENRRATANMIGSMSMISLIFVMDLSCSVFLTFHSKFKGFQ